jgi:hypothetical protein
MGKIYTFSSKYYNQQKFFNVSMEQQQQLRVKTNKQTNLLKKLRICSFGIGDWVPWARYLPLAVNTTTCKNSSMSSWSSSSNSSSTAAVEDQNKQTNKFIEKIKDL